MDYILKRKQAGREIMNSDKKNKDFKIIKNGTITTVPGVFASAAHCGIKSSKKDDICIIYFPEGSNCSAVFTKNKFAAAPVLITKEQLKKSRGIKAAVINSGIANACTGQEGFIKAKKMIDITAGYLNISSDSIIVASTGVIGKQLPLDKIEEGIKKCSHKLSPAGGSSAAKAILTTDKVAKETAVFLNAEHNRKIVIGGIAKGSGMIEPDMATLLVFIATSAEISGALLDEILHEEAESSFNSITIDGCQSTNDMVAVIAGSGSGIHIENKKSPYYRKFKSAFSFVMKDLARKIVMDGEGATKLITIKIVNAKDKKDAKKLALKVANSNLFKTAMFGRDLNWGRINAALGSSECDFNPDRVDIYIDSILIVKNGTGIGFDGVQTAELMKKREIKFMIDLNLGKEEFEVMTADLSFDYIKINALYHT